MKEGTVGEWGYCGVASFPGPVPRAGGRAWFQLFTHVLNCRGIPRWPHTIDILSYSCDANTDTTHYTVHRFTIAAYVLERNSLVCTYPGRFEAIKWNCEHLWSRFMRRGYLPAKPPQEVTWGFIALLSALSAGLIRSTLVLAKVLWLKLLRLAS